MTTKKGDTLIEVALALGIFSMVAISIVSVVSASTSGAQSSLETTVAREEVDVQAEALRFIHESYISGGRSNAASNDRYAILWSVITSQAKNKSESLTFNPTTCAELYADDSLMSQGAFLINPRALSLINTTDQTQLTNVINNRIIIRPKSATDNGVFVAPTTYPRVLYDTSPSTTDAAADASLLDQNSGTYGTGTYLSRAEGIYVVAIKDDDTTTIISGTGVTRRAAYYDFYIRTCWFAPGADRPSSVSTVIRLYDPDIIAQHVRVTFVANYDGITTTDAMPEQLVLRNTREKLNANSFTRPGYTFVGWSTNPNYVYNPAVATRDFFADRANVTLSEDTILYAVWRRN